MNERDSSYDLDKEDASSDDGSPKVKIVGPNKSSRIIRLEKPNGMKATASQQTANTKKHKHVCTFCLMMTKMSTPTTGASRKR